jgi:hypothetical protein
MLGESVILMFRLHLASYLLGVAEDYCRYRGLRFRYLLWLAKKILPGYQPYNRFTFHRQVEECRALMEKR